MVRKAFILRSIVCACLLAAGLVFSPVPAGASADTILAVKPPEANVPLGNQILFELEITNGIYMNAFDIMVNYDTQRLSLASWTHGDYLDRLSCLHEVNQPGIFELACTQIASPEVSGDGILLALVFDTLDVGLADVTITEAEFADVYGVKTQPEKQNGLVDVQNVAAYTPTRTLTRTLTSTPTLTVTQTMASTQTLTNTATQSFTPTLTASQDLAAVPPGTADGIDTPAVTATLAVFVDSTQDPAISTPNPLGQETPAVAPEDQEQLSGGIHDPAQDSTQVDALDEGQQDEDEMMQEATAAQLGGAQVSSPTSEESRVLGLCLWGVLIAGVIALIIMFNVLIQRRKNTEEDLLL